MNHYKKALLAFALAAASASAHAAQADILVWAEIDPSLALTTVNGDALPPAAEMPYNPNSGLMPWVEQVRILSNETGKDVEVRLASAATLLPRVTAPGAAAIPLVVSLNDRPLDVTVENFTAAELYNGGVPGSSIIMPLRVAQATPGRIDAAGRYEGMVSIVLAHKAGSL